MKKTLYTFFTLTLLSIALPVLAAAPKDFKAVVNDIFIGGLLKPIVPFLIGLAVIVFIYGVLMVMISEGGDKKENGKQYMMWGIIGIFVMVSVWGLVNLLQGTFGLENSPLPIQIQVPTLNQ